MSKGKLAAIISICALIVIVIVCGVVFYQVPFDYDIGSIHAVENDVVLLTADDPLNNSGSPALAKIKDSVISSEDFRILFLTDVHLCEQKAPTRRTIERMVTWIYTEKPDLIILGGDTLNGLNDRVRVEQFRTMMDKFGIYWAPVLGNHEGDRPFLMTSREEVVKIWSVSPLCLMESDVKKTSDGRTVDGYGNYVVSVLGADGYIKDAFFMLDNGSKLMKKSDYEKWEVEKKADTAISTAPQHRRVDVRKEGGLDVLHDFVDLAHVTDAEGGQDGREGEEDAQELAQGFAALVATKPFAQVVHRSATPFLLAVTATVVDAKDVLGVVGHHSQEGRDPHPEDRTRPAHRNGGRDAGDVAGTNGGGQCRAKCLELRDGVSVGLVMGMLGEELEESLLAPVAQMGNLEASGDDGRQEACAQQQHQTAPSPDEVVDDAIELR